MSDDVWVPHFSLLAVVWGVCFVHAWRRRQATLGFRWGDDDSGDGDDGGDGGGGGGADGGGGSSGGGGGGGRRARRDELRPDFVGREVVSEVSGAPELTMSSPAPCLPATPGREAVTAL